MRAIGLRDEILHEQWNVVPALAQRWNVETHTLQSIVEVLPEGAVAHRFGEVAVGRRDHAHVHLESRHAADAHDVARFEHAQETHLHVGTHLPHFIQEHRARVRALEKPRAPCHRSGERALLVPEELALEHALGERATIDGFKGTVAAGAVGVNGVGDDILARPAFALDQDGNLGGSNQKNRLKQVLQARAAPDDSGSSLERDQRQVVVQGGAKCPGVKGPLDVEIDPVPLLVLADRIGLWPAQDHGVYARGRLARPADEGEVGGLRGLVDHELGGRVGQRVHQRGRRGNELDTRRPGKSRSSHGLANCRIR